MIQLPLILLCVLINTAAQLLLKQGMNRIGHFDFSWSQITVVGTHILLNPYIITGFFFYVLSVGVWLLVLSRVEVSYAYPMMSLGYIATTIAGYLLFNEHLSLSRISGVFVIMIGVYLITRSA